MITNEKSIGVLELNMLIVRKLGETIDNQRFSVHILYSLWGDNLVARCLDFDTCARIDILQELDIKKRNKMTNDKMSRHLLNAVTKECLVHTIDYIELSSDKRVLDIPQHSPEEYWSAFREIRKERDNYYLKKLFDYPEAEVHRFINPSNELEEYLSGVFSSDAATSAKDVDCDAYVKYELTDKVAGLEPAA